MIRRRFALAGAAAVLSLTAGCGSGGSTGSGGFTIYDDLMHCAVGGVYAPALRTRSTTPGAGHRFAFEENMVVVVQPNVVSPDHRMGVQVGEMLRVTAAGVESFHSIPRQILRCG